MRRKVWVFTLAFMLLFASAAYADEEHNHSSTDKSNDTQMENMSPEEHENMDMNSEMDMDHSDMNTDSNMDKDHSNTHTDIGSTGGHDHGGGPVKETPANLAILGSFGAIMGLFLLIGIWNKWFRKKEKGAH